MIRGRMSSLVLAGAMLFSMAGVACGGHRAYRVYDPYYTDYHQWNGDEDYYYRRWANETRRDSQRDFRRLPPQDQKEYWTWRHNHGDHDRNRDHDRDHDRR
jgi:hypothetical protein